MDISEHEHEHEQNCMAVRSNEMRCDAMEVQYDAGAGK